MRGKKPGGQRRIGPTRRRPARSPHRPPVRDRRPHRRRIHQRPNRPTAPSPNRHRQKADRAHTPAAPHRHPPRCRSIYPIAAHLPSAERWWRRPKLARLMGGTAAGSGTRSPRRATSATNSLVLQRSCTGGTSPSPLAPPTRPGVRGITAISRCWSTTACHSRAGLPWGVMRADTSTAGSRTTRSTTKRPCPSPRAPGASP
jgi:hypothetical protein